MRYSLADYILTVKCEDQTLKTVFGTFTIGGQGSTTDSIEISGLGKLYSTTGYATGGFIQEKNLDKTGSASVSISPLSENAAKLRRLVTMMYENDYDSLTLTLCDNKGHNIAILSSVYPEGIPNQNYGTSHQNQTWSFTAGEVNYPDFA